MSEKLIKTIHKKGSNLTSIKVIFLAPGLHLNLPKTHTLSWLKTPKISFGEPTGFLLKNNDFRR